MPRYGISQSVTRIEDPRLLRGMGQYVDDINLPDQVYGYVVRSDQAHAKILSVDIEEARAAPGVLLILTGEDREKDGLGYAGVNLPRKRRDGSDMYIPPHHILVKDEVKVAGDHVAFVVAETPEQAKDAAELVMVDYEPLDAVVDTYAASLEDAPQIWPDAPGNECFHYAEGDKEATEKAFKDADHVIEQRMVINRITANYLEPRGCIGVFDPHEERYTLYATTQAPHTLRQGLAAAILKIPEQDLRVIAPDVGGGFGTKGQAYNEYALCLWASKKVGRPVKWICERSEGILTDDHARDHVVDAAIAFNDDGKFMGVRYKGISNIGAYCSTRASISPSDNLGSLTGTYTTPALYAEVLAVFTNTTQTGTYRGAGRPEAALVIERLIDMAADKIDMDRAKIRKINSIPPEAMPYKTPMAFTYDSGEFEKNLDTALKMADYENFEKRREEAAKRGKLRGIGISNTIEKASAKMYETAEIRFHSTGNLTMNLGAAPQGQGHVTTFMQVLSEKLGVDSDMVRIVQGDTDKVMSGVGTFGSRSAVMAGSAIVLAANKLVAKGKKNAAHFLEADEKDVEFDDGNFKVKGTNRFMHITEVAKKAYVPHILPEGVEPGFHESGVFASDGASFPNGCHVIEVEIDPDTGVTRPVNYVVVDDVGTVINPLLVKGQIHGGIAQGVGQALMEDMVFDKDTGQLLSGSFTDYTMPRASDFCNIEIATNAVPSPTNPLGAKGAGEAGTVGSLAAMMNAVVDALKPYGVKHMDCPATPGRVWRAIHDAKNKKSAAA